MSFSVFHAKKYCTSSGSSHFMMKRFASIKMNIWNSYMLLAIAQIYFISCPRPNPFAQRTTVILYVRALYKHCPKPEFNSSNLINNWFHVSLTIQLEPYWLLLLLLSHVTSSNMSVCSIKRRDIQNCNYVMKIIFNYLTNYCHGVTTNHGDHTD